MKHSGSNLFFFLPSRVLLTVLSFIPFLWVSQGFLRGLWHWREFAPPTLHKLRLGIFSYFLVLWVLKKPVQLIQLNGDLMSKLVLSLSPAYTYVRKYGSGSQTGRIYTWALTFFSLSLSTSLKVLSGWDWGKD